MKKNDYYDFDDITDGLEDLEDREFSEIEFPELSDFDEEFEEYLSEISDIDDVDDFEDDSDIPWEDTEEYAEWCEYIKNKYDVTQEMLDALSVPVNQRTPTQAEWVSILRRGISDGYDAQESFIKDENDVLQNVPYSSHGSSRPDQIKKENDKYYIIEDKVTNSINAILPNVKEQTHDRYEVFGEDTDILYRINPGENFSIADAEKLTEAIEKLDADVEYVTK